jgi:hypothetical protein
MTFVMGGFTENDDDGNGDGNGFEAVPISHSSMERYDALTGQWLDTAPTTVARHSFGCCAIAGEIIVTGGLDADYEQMSNVEKYSPWSDTWCVMEPLPKARAYHSTVAVGSAMYVLGGHVDGSSTADVLLYDGAQGRWRDVAHMPAEREDCITFTIGSDLCVSGGRGPLYDTVNDVIFKYDTVTDVWSTLAPMAQASVGCCASMIGGLAYIVGSGEDVFCEVMRYDPLSQTFEALAHNTDERFYCNTFVAGCNLYALGRSASERSVERYNVVTNTWTAMADMHEGRQRFETVTIGSECPAKVQDLFDTLIARAHCKHPAQ